MGLGKYCLIFATGEKRADTRHAHTATSIGPNKTEFDKHKDNTHRKYKNCGAT